MSIFDESDKKEAEEKALGMSFRKSNIDEQLICDDMARLLDEPKDFPPPDPNSYAMNPHTPSFNQFESADRQAELRNQEFKETGLESFGFSVEAASSEFKFPDDNKEGSIMEDSKPFWRSNPIPTPSFNTPNYGQEFGSTPHMGYQYYQQPYSPFDQVDQREYHANSSSYASPDNFNGVHNAQYYNGPQPEEFKSPEVDFPYNYNSGSNIFAAFDQQEKSNVFENANSGQDHVKFASSNMASTTSTSNYNNQFGGYPNCGFPQPSRISCPSQLRSKGKLDSKLKMSAPKFKSGESAKSLIFVKNLESRLSDSHSDVVISDILGQGRLPEIIKNQKGSRFVQDAYYTTTEEEKEQIFEEIKESWKELIVNRFANYVIQKIFESGPESQKEFFALNLVGSMISMSMEDYACRIIQKLLENLKSETRLKLISELHENVEKLIYNCNGNHVIQKSIEFVPEKYLNFIIEEVGENIYAFSTHKYGWRVIEKMIEFCKCEEVDNIVEEILPMAKDLAIDKSGNYVWQAILKNGKTRHKKTLVSILKASLLNFATNKYASNVIECCFKFTSNSQRKDLVKELLKSSSKSSSWALEILLCDKFGNYVIQNMLEKADENDRKTIVSKLKEIVKRRKQLNQNAKIVFKAIKEKGLYSSN